MKFNPNNPLTDMQINKLSEEDFFTYLDSKSEYLKTISRPLSAYECKQFTSLNCQNTGQELTIEKIKHAEEIGKENEKIMEEKIKETMIKKGLQKPKLLIKNHKTHRSQWFD